MGFLGSDKLIVGYDLGNNYSQISFAVSESGEAETLSQVAGEQKYNIPTVLCKRYGVNQWLYGREALRGAREEQGILVENLVELALDGETVVVDGETYDPVALLALFLKRSLGMLSQVKASSGSLAGLGEKRMILMLTCPVLDRKIIEVLSSMVEGLHLKADRVFFQSYGESFYNYMLRQPKDLWSGPSVLFDYNRDGIKAYRMECNRRTTPVVAFIDEEDYDFPAWGEPPEGTGAGGQSPEAMDALFVRIVEDVCGRGQVGSAFLIGDGFAGGWMKESLRLLCRGRRVFQGNNLFSKGACCGAQEWLCPGELGRGHVYLGRDKLKANIGMKIFRQGEDSYYALLDAGMNWYEAEQSVEFYIQDGNEIALTVTPLIKSSGAPGSEGAPSGAGASGRGERSISIALTGLQGTVARLRMHIFLKAENVLEVEVEDLGFGKFREMSGRVWRETVEIYQCDP